MFESIVSPIWVTNILAWAFTLSFALAWVFEKKSEHISRKIRIVAWFLFGIFWLLLTPRFAIVMRSPIETVLSFLAIPICFHAGYLLLTEQSLRLSLSNAIAVMGIVYLPFETIEPLGIFLINIVTQHVYLTILGTGFDVILTDGPVVGHKSGLLFSRAGHDYLTHIVLACTGIGTITIFLGLITSLSIPLSRKAIACIVTTSLIYILNILRNAFIAISFGEQWFQWFVPSVLLITGYDDPRLVSFFIADRVLSQSLTVLVVGALLLISIRIVPEIIDLLEELLYLLTRKKYDLHYAFEPTSPNR
ncbi:MAG: archaeosortase A [Halobacteriales archaeon]